MDQRFHKFVNKWMAENVSDLQRISISDWLSGRNQTNLVHNKTTIKKDNNLLETPYRIYNRYKVEYPPVTEPVTT